MPGSKAVDQLARLVAGVLRQKQRIKFRALRSAVGIEFTIDLLAHVPRNLACRLVGSPRAQIWGKRGDCSQSGVHRDWSGLGFERSG